MTTKNRCTACGACCACFTVVVDSAEIEDPGAHRVPLALIIPAGKAAHAMKGTEGKRKRCAALNGIVGQAVYCAVYETRPASCRGFLPAWEAGVINPKCDMARAAYGLFAFSVF